MIMKSAEVSEVVPGSLAERHGIKPGDRLVAINGRTLRDILDYQLCVADERLVLEIVSGGERREIAIDGSGFAGLGIRFSTSLFDGIKTCANKCVFCFIDQLPPGMRDAVYVKDDDYRLSLLYGNFVTLTNVKDEEIDRIIEDRISPLYVSLHAANPDVRALMLGRKKADRTLEHVKRLSDAGIELHVQMVLCPGLNDGDELERSLRELSEGYPGIDSVGLVPVGLTGHRQGLYPLRSFEKQEIMKLIDRVERWQNKLEAETGAAWVYIADEFYIAAGRELPLGEHYGDYPQIENGIGLSRLFIDEAMEALAGVRPAGKRASVALVTGELFAQVLRGLADEVERALDISIDVVAVPNVFFGGGVNVTGLLTGLDIVNTVIPWRAAHGAPDMLLVPDVVLNADGLMLDDYSPEMLAEGLGLRVEIIPSGGTAFVEGLEELVKG